MSVAPRAAAVLAAIARADGADLAGRRRDRRAAAGGRRAGRRARRAPPARRSRAQVRAHLARGVPAPLRVTPSARPGACACASRRRRRSPSSRARPTASSTRRSRRAAAAATRCGRWRCAARDRSASAAGATRAAGEQEVTVYPDVPAARRLALAVRQGRFRSAGRLTRGPLGLGTEFESIRDYEPDDDIRQVNWRATERMQRPMSNQFRVEQDREVMLLIDAGRLMASPLGDRTRLDAAVDAAVAVALVADVLGDRAGTLAFDREVRRQLAPRRAGGHAVVRALLDLEPRAEESDYELAFRSVEGAKRSLMLIFCDLLEETAAKPLVDAVPVLSRRHAVTVASVRDPDLDEVLATAPDGAPRASARRPSRSTCSAPARASRTCSGAPARRSSRRRPTSLAAACVTAYLRAKARGRGVIRAARARARAPSTCPRRARRPPRRPPAAGGAGSRSPRSGRRARATASCPSTISIAGAPRAAATRRA